MGYWFGVPTGACIVMVAQIFYFGVLRAVMPLSDLKPLMFEMPWTILLLRRLRFLAHFPPNVKAAVTGFMYSVPCTSRPSSMSERMTDVFRQEVPIFVWKLSVASKKTVLPSEGVRRWSSNLICVIPCMTSPSQSEVTGPNLSSRWARFAFVSLRPVVLDLGV